MKQKYKIKSNKAKALKIENTNSTKLYSSLVEAFKFFLKRKEKEEENPDDLK